MGVAFKVLADVEPQNAPSGVAQLVDLKVGPTADDEMMLDFLGQTGMPLYFPGSD